MDQAKELKQPQNAHQVMQTAKSQFLALSIDNKISWDAELRFAIQLLNNNKYTHDVAMNNPDSLRNAIVNISAIGISLNPATKHAYLVPRKQAGKPAICLDISYMGLLHLACMSGSIMWGQSKIVRAEDNYQNMGVDNQPKHLYSAFTDRGAIVGVYCTVKTVDGDYLTEEMNINDVWDIRDRSEAYKKKCGPWISDTEQMIRKTVVKRASSYWPKVERLNNAIHMLNTDNEEGINFNNEKPAGKSGNWRPGKNPDLLPDKLREVFINLKEAYEIKDFQQIHEILGAFDIIEEKIAVGACFSSDERRAISKFKESGEYVENPDTLRVAYLNKDELDSFIGK